MKNEFSPGDEVWCCIKYPRGVIDVERFIIGQAVICSDHVEYNGTRRELCCLWTETKGVKEEQLGRTKEEVKTKYIRALIFEKNKLIEDTRKEIKELERTLKEVQNE